MSSWLAISCIPVILSCRQFLSSGYFHGLIKMYSAFTLGKATWGNRECGSPKSSVMCEWDDWFALFLNVKPVKLVAKIPYTEEQQNLISTRITFEEARASRITLCSQIDAQLKATSSTELGAWIEKFAAGLVDENRTDELKVFIKRNWQVQENKAPTYSPKGR
ncbi:hypothetical protein PAAG_05187 [Paracoccidioides lutzii Pb01]|uniref:Uncharacterized protein n=1 Tax=Paracoccidioides lutzii (strain ATCC MYA-826 / Pb01) TaxID=502779 RepID=C1H344_PARBA|nr:hypothetical protein PAAG_05187 [Paracoccidioides lutzii Pb01]EEH34138.2 hypothetical protein PAAG_05187 [Paracoccidioides lutzii Pb01]